MLRVKNLEMGENRFKWSLVGLGQYCSTSDMTSSALLLSGLLNSFHFILFSFQASPRSRQTLIFGIKWQPFWAPPAQTLTWLRYSPRPWKRHERTQGHHWFHVLDSDTCPVGKLAQGLRITLDPGGHSLADSHIGHHVAKVLATVTAKMPCFLAQWAPRIQVLQWFLVRSLKLSPWF